jgi:hypothetical protein
MTSPRTRKIIGFLLTKTTLSLRFVAVPNVPTAIDAGWSKSQRGATRSAQWLDPRPQPEACRGTAFASPHQPCAAREDEQLCGLPGSRCRYGSGVFGFAPARTNPSAPRNEYLDLGRASMTERITGVDLFEEVIRIAGSDRQWFRKFGARLPRFGDAADARCDYSAFWRQNDSRAAAPSPSKCVRG